MNESRKYQVSLRGASAKEITRDALLVRVNRERELRNHNRRVNAAVLLVQRAWRRHHGVKSMALRLRDDWEMMMNNCGDDLTGRQICGEILRPFLFFINYLSVRLGKIDDRDRNCMSKCFKTVLGIITLRGACQNFSLMAIGSKEGRKIWFYQSKKLTSVCLFVLSMLDYSHQKILDFAITSTAMRLAVLLTDPKGWKCMADSGLKDANSPAKEIFQFVGNKRNGLYTCIRMFICRLETPFSAQEAASYQKDDRFLIVASTITLSLRPFHITDISIDDKGLMESVIVQFIVSLFTIPWFPHRLPTILIPAFSHKSVLSPCLKILLASKEKILKEILEIGPFEATGSNMPHIGWILANIVYLATGSNVNALGSGTFTEDLDHASYIRVVILLSDNLLASLEINTRVARKNGELQINDDTSAESLFGMDKTAQGISNLSYMDLFSPVCQQWHLKELLAFGRDASGCGLYNLQSNSQEYGLLEIAYYYSCMLRLFSILNPVRKSLPVLNMLSFTPGFLVSLWVQIDNSLVRGKNQASDVKLLDSNVSGDKINGNSERKKKRLITETGNKWVNMLQKITGKSTTESSFVNSVDGPFKFPENEKHHYDEWDEDPLRQGAEGMTNDISCLLLLFYSSYSHLLLVLDDAEFYDKQVPFTLEQQRRIASLVNTLVYNSFFRVSRARDEVVDSAVRCLHLLYERDCRRQFCDPSFWLCPGKSNRIPIAVAARNCEIFSAGDGAPSTAMGSVITTMPHVFPFEERVKLFRELVSMDKVSRRVVGEGSRPRSRSIEIVVRRDHILEDGFQQLNSLGSRLKSVIHVSFVSQSGLPEAGLDYGGLSKEFWTDIAKAAFSPEYGLFSQTSTSDRLIIPNTAARFLDNGIQMIEFMGKIVGKSLYEGILLDFCFSHVFVQKLLGRYSFLDELSTLDPELYRNLMYVKHYEGDVKDLSLDFTVTEELLGKRLVIELKPGGKDICVTNENKLHYVHAMADYKLNRQVLPFSNAFYRGLADLISPSWLKLFNASEFNQVFFSGHLTVLPALDLQVLPFSNAFYRGLADLISPSWLKLFNASEFNQLLSGGDHDIDVDDLKRNTQYTGGYTEGSRTIKLFWEIFAGFEPRERCTLLKFVTSCSRGPLLGFKYLHPAFTIHKVVCDVPLLASFGGQDVDRLPSASTCYNTLKLPTYKRANTLRAKLLYAIHSNAGFELS